MSLDHEMLDQTSDDNMKIITEEFNKHIGMMVEDVAESTEDLIDSMSNENKLQKRSVDGKFLYFNLYFI